MSDERTERQGRIQELEPDAPEGGAEARQAEGPSASEADDPAGESVPEAASSELDDPAREVELEAEIAELKEKLLRKQAELINYRRRMERERAEQILRARAAVVRELLPVIDDFERAVQAEPDNAEAYRQGVDLILKSLQDTLRRLGVDRIEPRDEPFDPNLHEAVERRPSDETPANQIVEVYQPGYRIEGHLIRPASVVVAANDSQTSESD